MRRRDFIVGLGGAAMWPVVAVRAQQDRMRRVGVLMGLEENDPEARARFSAFAQALSELGWTDGRNLRMEVRWAAGDVDQMRMFAKECIRKRHRSGRPGLCCQSAAPCWKYDRLR